MKELKICLRTSEEIQETDLDFLDDLLSTYFKTEDIVITTDEV